jgi:hypothetical protein
VMRPWRAAEAPLERWVVTRCGAVAL